MNKHDVNLIEQNDFFILYNDSHTILVKDESLKVAYKKYKTLEGEIEKKFQSLDMDFNIDTTPSVASGGKLKIESSNKTLMYVFIFLFIFISYVSYTFDIRSTVRGVSHEIQNTLTHTIRSLPSTIKNTIMYTKNGEPWCYPCALEEIVDGINEGTSKMNDQDMERLRKKIQLSKNKYGFNAE